MKKVLLTLLIVFAILCFLGAAYVIYTRGKANPGYGIIPMLFCIICVLWYRSIKNRDSK